MNLIEDTTARLLDDLFLLLHAHKQDKKDIEKTTKNMIKISVKIGMLERGGKFNLKEKSVGRVEQIFGVVKTEDFLDQIYHPKLFVHRPEMRLLMGNVVDDLTACLDKGTI